MNNTCKADKGVNLCQPPPPPSPLLPIYAQVLIFGVLAGGGGGGGGGEVVIGTSLDLRFKDLVREEESLLLEFYGISINY